MSKTTSIANVPIKDLAALRSAVAELKASGVNCSLVEKDAMCRLWYSSKPCPLVLSLPDCQFDVGFEKQKDNTYTLIADLHGGYISQQIGASCPISGHDRNQHAVGRLMQSYSKHAAMNAAAEAGYMVSNCYTDERGEIQLEIATG